MSRLVHWLERYALRIFHRRALRLALRHPHPDSFHVSPRRDLIAHDLSDDCVCGPTTEPVKREDGSIGWVITHHALDGRA